MVVVSLNYTDLLNLKPYILPQETLLLRVRQHRYVHELSAAYIKIIFNVEVMSIFCVLCDGKKSLNNSY